MTSVDSNFNFLCGRPLGAGPPPPVHMRPLEPDPPPPPCERHKWMAPNLTVAFSRIVPCMRQLHFIAVFVQRLNRSLCLALTVLTSVDDKHIDLLFLLLRPSHRTATVGRHRTTTD